MKSIDLESYRVVDAENERRIFAETCSSKFPKRNISKAEVDGKCNSSERKHKQPRKQYSDVRDDFTVITKVISGKSEEKA